MNILRGNITDKDFLYILYKLRDEIDILMTEKFQSSKMKGEYFTQNLRKEKSFELEGLAKADIDHIVNINIQATKQRSVSLDLVENLILGKAICNEYKEERRGNIYFIPLLSSQYLFLGLPALFEDTTLKKGFSAVFAFITLTRIILRELNGWNLGGWFYSSQESFSPYQYQSSESINEIYNCNDKEVLSLLNLAVFKRKPDRMWEKLINFLLTIEPSTNIIFFIDSISYKPNYWEKVKKIMYYRQINGLVIFLSCNTIKGLKYCHKVNKLIFLITHFTNWLRNISYYGYSPEISKDEITSNKSSEIMINTYFLPQRLDMVINSYRNVIKQFYL